MPNFRPKKSFQDIRPPQAQREVAPEPVLEHPKPTTAPSLQKTFTQDFHRSNRAKKNKIALAFFLIILSILGTLFFLFGKKIYTTEKKSLLTNNQSSSLWETVKNIATSRSQELKHTDPNRLNILLLGLAGEHRPGSNLTDTIMIASIDLSTNRVALISLPRDLYVKIPETKQWTKINSVYQYGLRSNNQNREMGAKVISQTVSQVTGLDIDYFVVLNFQGFTEFIDAIGGVDIMNERDIYDNRYPGLNYSYETFSLEKGFHHLDGATALKYARERHDDPEGDFGRAKRQQQIIESAKRKFFSSQTLLNPWKVGSILETIGNNLITNLSLEEIISLWELAKKLDTQNISNIVVDAWNKDSLLKVSHVFYGATRSFVLVPRIGNWNEVHDLSKNAFDLDAIKRARLAIQEEKASIGIINRSGQPELAEKIYDLLKQKLGYKNVFIYVSTNQKEQTNTEAFDLTNGTMPFTLNELSGKIPARILYGAPDNENLMKSKRKDDIILILGNDIADHYLMATDSIEDWQNSMDNEEMTNFINQ